MIRRLGSVLGALLVGAGVLAGMVVLAPDAAAQSIGSGLTANQWLNTNQSLDSGAYSLLMQGDGNLVLYTAGHPIWDSNTVGHAGAHLILQNDGNLVIYQNSTPLWSAMTSGFAPGRAVMQSDGNFVLYEGGTAPWFSGTEGGRNEITAGNAFQLAWSKLNSYPYSWAAGHGATPGPTYGQCDSAGCAGLTTYGFDCSGFTRWIYSLAAGRDILGAGNTNNQIAEMHQVTNGAPGDLIFFGSSTGNTDHVGIYIGNNKMINAYDTGTRIQVNNIADGGHFLGFWHY